MKNTPWILIKYYYDEVHDCWVAHYRDNDGLLQIVRSISKPKEPKFDYRDKWENAARENLY